MDPIRTPLREFLEIPYEQLEDLNLASKEHQEQWVPMKDVEAQRREYLENEKRIKAVTVAFTDLEGRLHMLDYDKKFLLDAEQLTFDGSSIRGFSLAGLSLEHLHRRLAGYGERVEVVSAAVAEGRFEEITRLAIEAREIAAEVR